MLVSNSAVRGFDQQRGTKSDRFRGDADLITDQRALLSQDLSSPRTHTHTCTT